MRIAFDYQAFCLQQYGGVARYFNRLAEELLLRGEDVGIFAPVYQNKYLTALPKRAVHGRNVNRYPPKTTKLALFFNHLLARPAIKKWCPDVVHETYFARKSSAPADCPVIITVHDMIHELYDLKATHQDNTAEIKRMAVDRADHIICVSQCTKRDLMRILGVPENKVTVVYHGFEPGQYGADTPGDTVAEEPFILYVGNRSGYKNFSRFMQSVAQSERLRKDFRVIAFGGGKVTKNEQLQIRQLGFVPGQIKQVGGCDAVLAGLYKQASAFVFPSLYEGFGLPPLEAMAHNCPVISSNSSCMPEVIAEAAEFFDPMEVDEMTGAMENVLYSNERSRSLKALGTERLKKFSWGQCCTATQAVYEQVVKKPGCLKQAVVKNGTAWRHWERLRISSAPVWAWRH